jgi:hypothetical protein
MNFETALALMKCDMAVFREKYPEKLFWLKEERLFVNEDEGHCRSLSTGDILASDWKADIHFVHEND